MTKVFEKNALDVWCEENKKTVDTPFTIADKTIKICCRDKEIIEDVIFYLRAYLRREYGEDDITEMLDSEICKRSMEYQNYKAQFKAAASKEETKGSSYD